MSWNVINNCGLNGIDSVKGKWKKELVGDKGEVKNISWFLKSLTIRNELDVNSVIAILQIVYYWGGKMS